MALVVSSLRRPGAGPYMRTLSRVPSHMRLGFTVCLFVSSSGQTPRTAWSSPSFPTLQKSFDHQGRPGLGRVGARTNGFMLRRGTEGAGQARGSAATAFSHFQSTEFPAGSTSVSDHVGCCNKI